MQTEHVTVAAELLSREWRNWTRRPHLDPPFRPQTRADAYRVQARLVEVLGDRPIGWKIAATSVAGQRHIGVTGPLAGRLLATRTSHDGSTVGIARNALRVAEAEFGFRIGRTLDRVGGPPLLLSEVIDAVDALVPAIEIPDSRYLDILGAGEMQLIADLACAGPCIFGTPAPDYWRTIDLAAHSVVMRHNHSVAEIGIGANALGDPRLALVWIANELREHGSHLAEGDYVITGTCVTPVPVIEGSQIEADFGTLGRVRVSLEA